MGMGRKGLGIGKGRKGRKGKDVKGEGGMGMERKGCLV